jgi:hypothetical protein
MYGLCRASDLRWVRYYTRNEMCIPLLQLLQIFRTWEASLRRDHLFALLGLAGNDGEDPEFAPDYDEHLDPIVKRYARRFIQRQEAYILDCAGLSRTSPQNPSWIPPWIEPHNESPTERRLTSFIDSTGTLQTMYSAATHRQADAQVLEESCVLRIRGVLIDRLSTIAQPIHRDGFSTDEERIQSFYESLSAFDLVLSNLKQCYTGKSLREVQLRTDFGNPLLADHILEYTGRQIQVGDKLTQKPAISYISPSQTYVDTRIDIIDETLDLADKDRLKSIDWDAPEVNRITEALVVWQDSSSFNT